jgi:hypothetical protein
MPPFESFDAFYALFLQAHRNVWNRRVHLLGWGLAAALALAALASGAWWLALLAPGPGLAAIWLGHWVIEPASEVEFKHPWLTARANLRMFGEMLSGRLPL